MERIIPYIMENKNVWNHQPVMQYKYYNTNNALLHMHIYVYIYMVCYPN